MSNDKGVNRFIEFVMGSNQEFYDTYLVNLSEEELELFMKDNPDFMKDLEQENKNKIE